MRNSLPGKIYFIMWTDEHQLNGLFIDWLSKSHALDGNSTFEISFGQERKEHGKVFEVYSHQTIYQHHSMYIHFITVNSKGCGVVDRNKRVNRWWQKFQTLQIFCAFPGGDHQFYLILPNVQTLHKCRQRENGAGRETFAVGQNYVGTWYCLSNLIFITIEEGNITYK